MSRGVRITMSVIASLSLGLWFGGLVMLFMSVGSLFQTFARETAGLGATGIFKRFEIFQMALAVVAIVSTYLSLSPGRARKIALSLLVVAAITAAVITFGISPRIDAMRIQAQTDTATFRRLHGLAMVAYLLVTHLVGAALIAVTISWRAGTSATASPDRASPGVPAGSGQAH